MQHELLSPRAEDSGSMAERVTFRLDDELDERIHAQLQYGDNRSELLRELLRDGLRYRAEWQTEADTERQQAEAAAAATGLDADWQAALVAVWAYLREVDAASPSEIRDAVHPEAPCDSSPEWWWKKLSGEIDELPGVERASQRRFEYEDG